MLDSRDPDTWRMLAERADSYRQQFQAGEISEAVFGAKMYGLGFRGAALATEIRLHRPAK